MLDNSPPELAAELNAHTPPRTAPGPSRSRAAKNASAIARTSSPSAEHPGGARGGGSAISTARATNQPHNTSTRARNRRSHDRTVVSPKPSASAIGRYPRPAAAISSAQPTTSTTSRRRASKNPGKSAWVRSHALQRARLTNSPKLARLTRTHRRYDPHRPSPPEHPGHRIPADNAGPIPALSIGPTHRRGTATINTGVSQEGPSDLAKDGGPLHVQGPAKSRRSTDRAPRALLRMPKPTTEPQLPQAEPQRRKPRLPCRTQATPNTWEGMGQPGSSTLWSLG